MGTRIISGIVLLVLLIGLLYAGGPVLLVAMLVISLIGLYEFYRALSNQHKPFQIIGYVAAILYYGVLLFREEWVRDGNFGLFFFIGLFWILMVLAVFSYPERRTEDVALTFAGVLYVPVLFSFVYFLRQGQDGMLYAPYIFWAAWGSDTCAYFTGRALGRHKLVPKLSPKKTVEGAIGGVVGAMAICLLYGGLIHSFVDASLYTVLATSAVIGLFGSVLGQVGDLFSSSVKRFMGVKDFGKLIPGHGGILDRFDSVLLTAPAVVMAINIVAHFGI